LRETEWPDDRELFDMVGPLVARKERELGKIGRSVDVDLGAGSITSSS
jgi:hypothetical protein